MSKKYGSFEATFKNVEGEESTYTVNPLSQHDLASGWRLVLPSRKRRIVEMKNKDDEDVRIVKTNESFFKINMAQLPSHLFSRMKQSYKRGQLTHYYARDNCYVYLVQLTPVDNDIRTLFYYINIFENKVYYLSDDDISIINYCLERVNEAEIKGWVVMKANRLFNNI